LNAAAAAAGMPAGQIDVFRPWFAGLVLSIAPSLKAGYDPQSGVEAILKARAEAAGKPIQGLETIDKQVGILAGMSEADQLAFLRSLLEAWEDATVELDRMVGAWATGDVALLEEIAVDEMQAESPVIYDALLVRRNTDWANQIQTMLAGSGTVFIAVGAAHLAGDDSVQEILEDRGVTVTRE
ncbi:MAG: TraB/GumN family protein, partial [Brevundimonas sp.]|uniref:TraB/GumN family protein n=1 Tax=Brevundimonas sp. TaxID=1871086 RepID=UPI00271BFCC8